MISPTLCSSSAHASFVSGIPQTGQYLTVILVHPCIVNPLSGMLPYSLHQLHPLHLLRSIFSPPKLSFIPVNARTPRFFRFFQNLPHPFFCFRMCRTVWAFTVKPTWKISIVTVFTLCTIWFANRNLTHLIAQLHDFI